MLPAKKGQKKRETPTLATSFAVTKKCYQMLPRFLKNSKSLLSQGIRRVTKMLPENVTTQKKCYLNKKAPSLEGTFCFLVFVIFFHLGGYLVQLCIVISISWMACLLGRSRRDGVEEV